MEKIDSILVQCDIEHLVEIVKKLEKLYPIKVTQEPSIALTMVRAEDSVENQEFYLGECLITDCEVVLNNTTGYGICVGDEPKRAYCIAVIDSILQNNPDNLLINQFLAEQESNIKNEELKLHNQILKTRVDFKMMEQA